MEDPTTDLRSGLRIRRNPTKRTSAPAKLRYQPSDGPQEAATASPELSASPHDEPLQEPKKLVRGDGPPVAFPEAGLDPWEVRREGCPRATMVGAMTTRATARTASPSDHREGRPL